jgi:hypothetical protein
MPMPLVSRNDERGTMPTAILPDVQKWPDEAHAKVLPDPLHTKWSFIG